MADLQGNPGSNDRPATPRWVKLLGVGAVVLILVAIAVVLVGGGQHGPGLHSALLPGSARPLLAVGAIG